LGRQERQIERRVCARQSQNVEERWYGEKGKKEKDLKNREVECVLQSAPILSSIVNSVRDARVVELSERAKQGAATKPGVREIPISRCTAVDGAHESGAAGRFL